MDYDRLYHQKMMLLPLRGLSESQQKNACHQKAYTPHQKCGQS
jgi:hypothetical protein